MHPSNEPPPPPPYAGTPPDGDATYRPSGWSGSSEHQPADTRPPAAPPGRGGPGYEAGPPVAPVREGRPWRVAIVAFLTMLVLIAAFGNQWVTDRITKHASTTGFLGAAERAVTTLSWRFTPGSNDAGRLWLSSVIGLGIVLVLILLLVALIVRGRGGFWQALLGTWTVVVFAVVVAVYARGFIIDESLFSRADGDRATLVFFGQLAPSGSVIATAVGYGFVVALVAALTSAFSRRTKLVEATVLAPYAAPEGYDADVSERRQEPWAAPAAAVPGPIASPSPWHNDTDTDTHTHTGDDTGTAAHSADDERAAVDERPDENRAQQTSVLPVVDDGPAPGGAHAEQSTAEQSASEQSAAERHDPYRRD